MTKPSLLLPESTVQWGAYILSVHNNNSVRVAQQKRCTLQLLLLWSFRTWRSIRCAGQPELPGNAGAVATSFIQKETKKPTKTSTPSSQKARRTTTTTAASTSGIINYRFLTTETNLKALYIFHCLFTTSSVKLFKLKILNMKMSYICWKNIKRIPKTPQWA